MIHNEDSRVKIPGLIHFLRLGYKYQSKVDANVHPKNNLFVDILKESIERINTIQLSKKQLELIIKEIDDLTNNVKDKGQSFFNRLLDTTGIKLIDLKNTDNNDFRVISELTFERNGKKFRPDITVIINGIPLGFIEVKKPNNREGIQAEFKRAKERSETSEFIPYFNQLQVLGFTNNLNYNDNERTKMSGSFYTTPNSQSTSFNHFREERRIHINEYLTDDLINQVILDNNILEIKNTSEFQTNLDPDTPCNQFITSLFSKQRLIWFIRYGIVYVDSLRDGMHKHIIRYPQFFALQEMIKRLEEGVNRGIVWHTQGSGKTAFAYFATNVLRDYFQLRNIVTKFYFVVDRLDLLMQATGEFSSRGMSIASINNKEDFMRNVNSPVVVENVGNREYKETMNAVNIQKFSEGAVVNDKINKKIQRIYFLDEVHRGYKPKGTFLSNLLGLDENGIFIGLTGTPILKKEFKSTDLFTGYIHKYYYNKSIADGYTLKIKKESISTELKTEVRDLFKLEEGQRISSKQWELVGKEKAFVDRVCEYMEEDFELFRDEIYEDNSLGYMIVTSSSEQARMIQEWYTKNSSLKTALVLYDEEYNKVKQEEFRGKRNEDRPSELQSEYQGVVVYNMLLTGFDAPRLKRLYLLRKIREHSLLQTLARVNRPYKNMKYGYIVDFVDITEEYEETNRRYLKELREDIINEDGIADVSEMFVDVEEVKRQLKVSKRRLFPYMGNIQGNLEEFSKQLEPLNEETLIDIRSSLNAYKECYNELRMAKEDVSTMPIDKVKSAYREVSGKIQFKRDEERLQDEKSNFEKIDFSNLIVEFMKQGEIDLNFTTENDILEIVSRIKNTFFLNNDKNDVEFIKYQQTFKDIMWSLKKDGDNTNKIEDVIKSLENINTELRRLNSYNKGITAQYHGDNSFMRIHKRLIEDYEGHLDDTVVFDIIIDVSRAMDTLLGGIDPTKEIMTQELMRPVRAAFKKQGIKLGKSQVLDVIELITDDKFTN